MAGISETPEDDHSDPEDQDEILDEANGAEEADDEFDAPMSEEGMGDLADVGDTGGEETVLEIEPQTEIDAAKSLELRRAIEARMEAKRLKEDLDYLDYDDE